MMKKLQNKAQEAMKDNKGFSLVELIIVIAIMAILIGIVGMNVIPQIENARKATDAQVISALVSEAMEAWTQVDSAATTATIKVDVDGSTGALSLGSGGSAGTALQNKFKELSFEGTGASRVLKSKAGKELSSTGITITCDPDTGVTTGALPGFDGYDFSSR